MRTVVIRVEGGNVTDVLADGEVDVIVHDLDNVAAGDSGPVEFPARQGVAEVQEAQKAAFDRIAHGE